MSSVKKWRCSVCGEVFEGAEPPVPCPVCGAGREAFEMVESSGKGGNKWRCSVCGEVFEGVEPPVPCPVCGANRDAFEEVVQSDANFSKDTNENFVIIGGGVAALATAKSLRERNNTAKISMICGEGVLPYNRPALSDVLADSVSFEAIALEGKDWYEQNNIDVILDSKAINIDRGKKQVMLSDNKIIEYDKLMIATGANAFEPIKPAPDGIKILSLRVYQDVLNIIKVAKKGSSCVLVGGGILGIEAAIGLLSRGVSVTIVERSDRILNIQSDEYGSKVVADELIKNGIKILVNEGVESILSDGIITKSGEKISCDFVLVSAGIRPEVTLAKDCGLEIGKGILVNENMKTSDDSIFAAGDCAEVFGRVAGLYASSLAMGQTAGAVMAGDSASYTPIVPATAIEEFGVSLFAAGTVNGEKLKFVTLKDNYTGIYKKLAFDNNKLCGVLLLGDTKQAVNAINNVSKGADLATAIKML